MGKAQSSPILIAGGGHRIGLALVWHSVDQEQPVIVSYRMHYSAIDGLIKVGIQCIQADFPTNSGMTALADEVLENTYGLCVILHNTGAWMAKKSGAPLTDILTCMVRIHVNTPYLLSHVLEKLLHGHGHTASNIIHSIDYMVERSSNKHITHTASEAALDSMTRSFVRGLAPEVKMDSTTPSLILFNEHDDAEYRQQTLNKPLMEAAPGGKKMIDLVDYSLTNCFVTGHNPLLDGGRHLR